MKRPVGAPDERHRYRKLISPTVRPSRLDVPRESHLSMLVTQLLLAGKLQESLVSGSAFYLLAKTFDPAERTSRLQQVFRTQSD